MVKELRVQMVGPVRQELLFGIRKEKQLVKLRNYLRVFPDLTMVFRDYERASELFNLNRKHGIHGSNTDFLICALSE